MLRSNKKTNIVKTLSILWIFLLEARVGSAATVRILKLQELVGLSNLIFQGTVIEVNRDLTNAQPPRPWNTKVTFRVQEVLKGTLSENHFELILPGGKGDRYDSYVPGVPKFQENEQVLILLEKTKTGFIPTGLFQGVFSQIDPQFAHQSNYPQDTKQSANILPHKTHSRRRLFPSDFQEKIQFIREILFSHPSPSLFSPPLLSPPRFPSPLQTVSPGLNEK